MFLSSSFFAFDQVKHCATRVIEYKELLSYDVKQFLFLFEASGGIEQSPRQNPRPRVWA